MKVREVKEKNLTIKEYLNMIKPYLSDIINDHRTHCIVRYHSSNKTWVGKTLSEWKIQLTMAINFNSSNDSEETRIMHTKSNNVEIMMSSETDKIIEELFKSFLQKYQEGDKWFQYALTVALNYEKIKDRPERISKIKPFFDQYNSKERDFPAHSKDWKKFESNNKSIALNILYVPHNTEKIRHAYKSK